MPKLPAVKIGQKRPFAEGSYWLIDFDNGNGKSA